MTTRFLLRIDDLCPTMDRRGWDDLLELVKQYSLKPILAIIPANRDPELMSASPDAAFWDEMRAIQDAGASIGLHGFDHVCEQRGTGLLPLHLHTEFVGLPLQRQRERIRAGLGILRGHGLSPKLFVAPRHGFDRNTLRALNKESIALISDGLARRPYSDHGVTWIPQQLWGPAEVGQGTWTLCLHPGAAIDLNCWRTFLALHASKFIGLEDCLSEPAAPLRLMERAAAAADLARYLGRRWIGPSRASGWTVRSPGRG